MSVRVPRLILAASALMVLCTDQATLLFAAPPDRALALTQLSPRGLEEEQIEAQEIWAKYRQERDLQKILERNRLIIERTPNAVLRHDDYGPVRYADAARKSTDYVNCRIKTDDKPTTFASSHLALVETIKNIAAAQDRRRLEAYFRCYIRITVPETDIQLFLTKSRISGRLISYIRAADWNQSGFKEPLQVAENTEQHWGVFSMLIRPEDGLPFLLELRVKEERPKEWFMWGITTSEMIANKLHRIAEPWRFDPDWSED